MEACAEGAAPKLKPVDCVVVVAFVEPN